MPHRAYPHRSAVPIRITTDDMVRFTASIAHMSSVTSRVPYASRLWNLVSLPPRRFVEVALGALGKNAHDSRGAVLMNNQGRPAPAERRSNRPYAQAVSVGLGQLAIGCAATLPFLRRRTMTTRLFSLTFWFAGLTTVLAQPIRTQPRRVQCLAGGAWYRHVAGSTAMVAWGLCATLVPLVHGKPSLDAPDRRRAVLKRCVAHLGILTFLLSLLPAALHDEDIREQGLWYPVRRGMSWAAALYALTGKLYEFGMFSWAPFAIWRGARLLSHPLMRLGAWLGEAVACGMLAQTIVVTAAQWRGKNFYASASGERTLALWRTIGTALPLATVTLVGITTRVRLLLLARDLRAFVRYVFVSIATHCPDRVSEVVGWVDRVMGDSAVLDGLLDENMETMGTSVRGGQQFGPSRPSVLVPARIRSLRHLWQAMRAPTADVDQLTVLLHDVLRALYPAPGDAMLLAARWLDMQPTECAEHLNEHNVAVLLLAATITGGDYGLFEPLPLAYPTPLEHISSLDRSWRTWGALAGAIFLHSVWRLVKGRADSTLDDEVVAGYSAVRRMLQQLGDEEREQVVLFWLDEVERKAQSRQPAFQTQSDENSAGDLKWWRLPLL